MPACRWLWGPLSPLGVGLAAADLAVDQAHKWWMLLDLPHPGARGRVAVTPFLDLVYVKNTGVSYGMFLQDSRGGQWLLAGLPRWLCWPWRSGWRAASPTSWWRSASG